MVALWRTERGLGARLTAALLLAGTFAAMSARASAGAWLMPGGEGQAIATLRLYRSQGGFDDRGQPLPAARYERAELSTYIEYGLTPRTTIGAEPRYQRARAGVGAFHARGGGLGDLDVFVRRGLFDYGPWTTSAQGLIKFPMYGRGANPARGNGRREYEFRVNAGRNIKLWMPGFIDAALAYRRGTSGLADHLRAEAALGVRPISRMTVLFKGLRTKSHDLGDGRVGSSYDLDKAEVSAVFRIDRSISVELGVSRDLGGERVGLGQAMMAALWVQF